MFGENLEPGIHIAFVRYVKGPAYIRECQVSPNRQRGDMVYANGHMLPANE